MSVDRMTCANLSPLSPNFFLRAGRLRSARVVNRGSSSVTALCSRLRLCLISAGTPVVCQSAAVTREVRDGDDEPARQGPRKTHSFRATWDLVQLVSSWLLHQESCLSLSSSSCPSCRQTWRVWQRSRRVGARALCPFPPYTQHETCCSVTNQRRRRRGIACSYSDHCSTASRTGQILARRLCRNHRSVNRVSRVV